MVYHFDQFELDPVNFTLKAAGTEVAVQPQVIQLLACLIENAGRMVSKEELNDKVWAGRVVSDAALSSRIKSGRQALGDDGKQQRYIQTVHRLGFKFVGQLNESAPTNPQPVAASAIRGDRPRVVVRPFGNLTNDASQDYFSIAISQDISANLAKYRWLDVAALMSLPTTQSLTVLNVQHGVGYVVEGSVRRSADRIRVSANLIDAESGSSLWADRFDRDIEDLFAVQDEITEKITARLEPVIGLSERQRVMRSRPRDFHAWDNFHLGIAHFFRFTAADNLESQRLLQKSREIDPKFAEANAWWAYANILGMVYWDVEPTRALLDRALQAAQFALEQDDQNALFYMLKARVQLARGDYSSAIQQNEMAIDLNPTLAAAHCGLADSLAYEGLYEDAIERFEIAIALSPNDPQRWAFYTYGALALIFQGNYQKALQWANQAIEIPNRQYWTLAHKAVAEAGLGQTAECKATVHQLIGEKPEFSQAFAKEKLFYIKRREQLEGYLDGLARAGIF